MRKYILGNAFVDTKATIYQHKMFVVRLTAANYFKRRINSASLYRNMSTLPNWATADPSVMGVSSDIHRVSNLVGGKWTDTKARMTIPDPMDKNAQPIFTLPDTQIDELSPFLESLRKVPKSGVHNPLKNPDRYVKYGEISRKV
jgi:hypothetical protein